MDISEFMFLCEERFDLSHVSEDSASSGPSPDCSSEDIKNEISKRVENVVRRIWSSVEYETACQDIDNFLKDLTDRPALNKKETAQETGSDMDLVLHQAVSPEGLLSVDSTETQTTTFAEALLLPMEDCDACVVVEEANNSDEFVSAVWLEWLSFVRFRRDQLHRASVYYDSRRRAKCMKNWIRMFHIENASRILEEQKAQEEEIQKLKMAEQFWTLYRKHRCFQYLIKVHEEAQRERAEVQAQRVLMEQERNRLSIAERYRKLYLTRKVLCHWKVITENIKRDQAMQKKSSHLRTKIEERILHETVRIEQAKVEQLIQREKPPLQSSVELEKSSGVDDSREEKDKTKTKVFVLETDTSSRHAELVIDRKLSSRLDRLASLHSNNRILLRFGWIPWRKQLECSRNSVLKAEKHLVHRQQKRVFVEWKLRLIPRFWKSILAEIQSIGYASQHWMKRVMKTVFAEWHFNSTATTFRQRKQTHNCWFKWRAVCEDSLKLQKTAIQFSKTYKKHSAFTAWLSYTRTQVALQQEDARAKEAALLKRLNLVRLTYSLKDWRAVIWEMKAEKKKARTLEKVKTWIQDFRGQNVK